MHRATQALFTYLWGCAGEGQALAVVGHNLGTAIGSLNAKRIMIAIQPIDSSCNLCNQIDHSDVVLGHSVAGVEQLCADASTVICLDCSNARGLAQEGSALNQGCSAGKRSRSCVLQQWSTYRYNADLM